MNDSRHFPAGLYRNIPNLGLVWDPYEEKIHTYTTANAVLGTERPTNTTAASIYEAWLKKSIKTSVLLVR